MTYQFSMTLSDLHGHAQIAGLLKCDFSCSCATVDKVSTNTARRAVPLRLMSFFLGILFASRMEAVHVRSTTVFAACTP